MILLAQRQRYDPFLAPIMMMTDHGLLLFAEIAPAAQKIARTDRHWVVTPCFTLALISSS
ncbi:MAG: hypothetical protein JWM58_1677 [Rhizobium sp.]|nr:hypothetical protein [Rhizobium sp.]